MKKVFIDGKAGTTGLRIYERLSGRDDVRIITLPEMFRKDPLRRKEALNSADIAFLCLPDAASRGAVSMIENPGVTVIDASTAHRTEESFAYGFPELGEAFFKNIQSKKRIAVPGCHASGFIALVYPLIECGILSAGARLFCHSVTGYSGGGKSMIAEYEENAPESHLSPRQYALGQNHKHLPEMQKIPGLDAPPVFCPVVSGFYSGMAVTVPLFAKEIGKGGAAAIKKQYAEKYKGPVVTYVENMDDGGFVAANACAGKDSMKISVFGNEERILLVALYDNLGKGASGAAIECMNIALGEDAKKGLCL